MELTIGCTTRPYGDLPFAEACEHIAAAGYTDVALFRTALDPEGDRKEALTARRIAEDAGLAPSMLLARGRPELGMEAAVSAYERVIDNAAALGASWILDTGTAREEHYDAYYKLLRRAAAYAESAGVQISLKPHGGITLTTDALIDAHKRVNHPAFGICYDPGNIIYYTKGEKRPETDVAQVAPLVTTGIIKDCIVRDGVPDVMITPGEGWVDFERVLSGLVGGGFRGPLYVECVGGTEIGEIDGNVRRTRAFIEGILSSL